MLYITVPANELWDDKNQEFITIKKQTLQLEHSLVSISKWESKWHKAFLGKQEKTDEETLAYIKDMTITQNVPDEVYSGLTYDNMQAINKYIESPMTATSFSENGCGQRNNETVTSEIIYYWMIALNIPEAYQKWHLNRLLALIRVCNIKNTPPKKRNSNEILRENANLNAARKKALHTSG